MVDQLDDYLSDDPERQVALFRTALGLVEAGKEGAEHIVQHIILRQDLTADTSQSASDSRRSEAKAIMMAILRELRNAGRVRVPDRAIFSVGSVAYNHCDLDVRKEAADLLVEWAIPTPPPAGSSGSPGP